MTHVSSPPDAGLLSINTATLGRQSSPGEVIEHLAQASIRHVTFWRDEVAPTGAAVLRRMLDGAGLKANSLCRGGMFPAPCAAERQSRIDDNLQAIDEAAALGARCLVVVCGGLPAGSKDLAGARQMVRDGLAEILPAARRNGVALAIEPLHPMTTADRSCINTLQQALDLCDALDPGASGAIGIAVDAYHVWWDPQLESQLERAGPSRLLDYHICDWLLDTSDRVYDRGMMGDGVIDLPRLRGLMQASGYRGPHDVEIFSRNDWWRRPIAEVLRTCRQRHQHCT